VILDTNIWIYIAESIGEAKVVPELVRLHAAGTIDLILLQTVLEEFDRNKSRVASKYYQRYSGVISSAKALKHLDGTPADFDVALDLCRKALDIAKQSIPKSVTAIEKLFASLIIFETTDTHRLEAFRRLYERRAPAHNAKVSTPGDCLIWECVLQNLRRGEVAFCTANKADFSNPVNEGELHPDLRTEAERRAYQLSYHVSVEALLDRIGAQESIKRSVASAAVRDRRLARAYQNIENYFAEGKHRPWLGLAVCDSCGEHTVPIANQGKPTKCYYCKCRYSAPEQCVRCAAWVLDGLRETGICRVCFDDLLLAEH
jgi:PIN domain